MLTPYPQQNGAVDQLINIVGRSNVSLNRSEMGTGKTLMSLELARRTGRPMFVVVPKAGIRQFESVAELQCVPLLGCKNLEALKTGKYPWLVPAKQGKLKYLWQLPAGSIVCIDEAHRMGGIESDNCTILAILKAYKSLHIHLMSATLATDPLRMRAAGFLLGLHHYAPVNLFYDWCRGRGCGISEYTQKWEFERSALRVMHLQRLHEDLQPFSIRLKTSDIPGFPENDIISTLVNLNERDTKEIQALYAEMREVVRNCSAFTAEVEMLRRRQRAEFLKSAVLADMVEDVVDDDKSAIVFCCFRDTLEQIGSLLQARGIESVKIMGGQSPAQRDAAHMAFQQNLTPVCLAMIQAGGVSIDLNDKLGRPRRTFVCPDWNPVNTFQALGRAPRAGSLSKVVQTFVLAADTIEESVHRTVTRKIGNIKVVNDGFASADERSNAAAEAATEGLMETLK